MRICEDCPEDLTGTPPKTILCRDCANERQRERVRQQKRKRICQFCKKELVNPKRATKYHAPCHKTVQAMSRQELQKNLAHKRNIRLTGGEKVAAKIADAVAKDKSYCMDEGSPYY